MDANRKKLEKFKKLKFNVKKSALEKSKSKILAMGKIGVLAKNS